MTNALTPQLKEDFLIKVYFNTSKGYENAGLKRAYLDFNRTLKIIDGNQTRRNDLQRQCHLHLKAELLGLISSKNSSQEEFDRKHKKVCIDLKDYWRELTIGQAQKWINMTLKYWLLFGEKRIKHIEQNAHYFHIPIDSYVQKGMFGETNHQPWSKILLYEDYFKYQLIHRTKKTGNPPLVDEFEFFNDYKDNTTQQESFNL